MGVEWEKWSLMHQHKYFEEQEIDFEYTVSIY